MTEINRTFCNIENYVLLTMLKFGLKERYELKFTDRSKYNEARAFYFDNVKVKTFFDYIIDLDEIQMIIYFKSKIFKSEYSFVFENVDKKKTFNEVILFCSYQDKEGYDQEYIIFTSEITDEKVEKMTDMIKQLIYFLTDVDSITKNMKLQFKIEVNREITSSDCILSLMNSDIIDEDTIYSIRKKIKTFFEIEEDHIDPLNNFEFDNLKHRIFLIPYLAISHLNLLEAHREQFVFFVGYLDVTKIHSNEV